MSTTVIRPATRHDLQALNELYNHYIAHTPTTFDTEPWSIERRLQWYATFAPGSRHQLLVADRKGQLLGYSCSRHFRAKKAYETSVESSIYLAPSAFGKGLGRQLYEQLFFALQGTGVHRVLAGVTLPNAASRALHQRLGFTPCGIMQEVGFKRDKYWDVEWWQRKMPF